VVEGASCAGEGVLEAEELVPGDRSLQLYVLGVHLAGARLSLLRDRRLQVPIHILFVLGLEKDGVLEVGVCGVVVHGLVHISGLAHQVVAVKILTGDLVLARLGP